MITTECVVNDIQKKPAYDLCGKTHFYNESSSDKQCINPTTTHVMIRFSVFLERALKCKNISMNKGKGRSDVEKTICVFVSVM